MTWDVCHFTVLQHKHTRALMCCTYHCGVVWCGVVWSDLHKNGLMPAGIGSYAAVRSAIYLQTAVVCVRWLLRRATGEVDF